MRVRVFLAVGLAAVLAACGAGTPEPAESLPPAPEAPAGWGSVGSFGGAGGTGLFGISLALHEGGVAVNASCLGSGTLVVMVSETRLSGREPFEAPSAIFPCGAGGQIAPSRVELSDAPVGEVTASAFVVEGGGTIRHAAYNVSLEQRAEAAPD